MGPKLVTAQLEIAAHTWFIVPKSVTLCRSDPMCAAASAKSPSGGPCAGGKYSLALLCTQSPLT